MVAMVAIALAAIVVGNKVGNSGGGGSSGGGGGGGIGCSDEDIGGYSDGVGHIQQSTKSGSKRNGGRDGKGDGDNDNDGKDNDGSNGHSGDDGIPAQQTTIK